MSYNTVSRMCSIKTNFTKFDKNGFVIPLNKQIPASNDEK